MKRARELIAAIAEVENLRLAFSRAARGKQSRYEVVMFRKQLQDNLLELRETILQGNVRVGNYRFFTVYEPKKREICAASFRQRVLHHAIMNVVEPVFERYAVYDSYACRKNKGLHAPIQRAQHFSRRYPWCLKLDIEKYFDSIDHRRIEELLSRRIKDKQLLQLFSRIISSYEKTPGKGMPIGNLISQHIANLYLGVLDHWIKEQLGVKGYLRYMDDFLIFADNYSRLKDYQQQLESFLASRLALKLHQNRQRLVCTQGIPYLGYRIFPDGIRLQACSRKRFRRKFAAFEEHYLCGEWDIEKLQRHVSALIGFTLGADSAGFRKKVIAGSRVLAEENEAITA